MICFSKQIYKKIRQNKIEIILMKNYNNCILFNTFKPKNKNI